MPPQPVVRLQSDARLVELVRSGNGAAFEAIVRRYRRPLLRHCSRLLGEQRAEDVVQQAFLQAFEAIQAASPVLNLRPWLYRIAHNAALNHLRDRAGRFEQLDDRIDGVERPDQAFERRQGLRDVVTGLKALPPRQRDAMVLSVLEGRSYDEIAAALGVTGGSVRQLLNRARTTLRTGASALTPIWLLDRVTLPHGAPTAERVAEIVAGGAGAGAVAAKLGATAALTGAVVGGVATLPHRAGDTTRVPGVGAEDAAAHPAHATPSSTPASAAAVKAPEPRRAVASAPGKAAPPAAPERRRERPAERGRVREEPAEDRSERRERAERETNGEGPNETAPGDEELLDHSGPGSGEDDVEEPEHTDASESEPEAERSGSGKDGEDDDGDDPPELEPAD